MIIDTHLHTMEFSNDSHLEVENAIARGKSMGLDGICVTDHESNGMLEMAEELSKKHDFLVLVGAEILTYEGDVLVFGLNDLPEKKIHADELVNLVQDAGGVSVSAHPFRDNGRGMGNYIRRVEGLSGIEAYNGSTRLTHNFKAQSLADELDLPCLGGSDAHVVERVGRYASAFPHRIGNVDDLIGAVKSGNVYPVVYDVDHFIAV